MSHLRQSHNLKIHGHRLYPQFRGSFAPMLQGGRIAAHEIMIGVPSIRNLIREDKVDQMYSMIQTGGAHGMKTLDSDLKMLVQRGLVSVADAKAKAKDPNTIIG